MRYHCHCSSNEFWILKDQDISIRIEYNIINGGCLSSYCNFDIKWVYAMYIHTSEKFLTNFECVSGIKQIGSFF